MPSVVQWWESRPEKKWGDVSSGLCGWAERTGTFLYWLAVMIIPNMWFVWDFAKLLTSFASMTVPTPTVNAMVGTFERSPSKNRALAMIVSFARVFTLVLETRLEPGSLKAMWPSGPIPDSTQGVFKCVVAWMRLRTNLQYVVDYHSLAAV